MVKILKRIQVLSFTFIGIIFFTSSAFAAPDLGEHLVRQLFQDIAYHDMNKLNHLLSPSFQAIRLSDVSDRQKWINDKEQELAFLGQIHNFQYKLSQFKTTQEGPLVVVTYRVTVPKILWKGIKGYVNPIERESDTVRLSCFIKTKIGWKWIAHASLLRPDSD